MTKKDVVLNEFYTAKVSGKKVKIQILQVSSRGGWHARNTVTGRLIDIKTAARLTPCRTAVEI